MVPARASRRRRLAFAAVLAAILFAAIEGASYLAVRWLAKRGVFYAPRVPNYERYLKRRDPRLGWVGAPTRLRIRDAVGSRRNPTYPDPERDPPLVSVYGDSFTWSDTVDDEHAWPHVLSRLLQRRVNNYGVNGYGTAQAYLRFAHEHRDRAPVVVLCHMSENVLRNVNRLRDLLYPGPGGEFTPRFLAVPGGGLELVPMPEFTDAAEFADWLRRPAAHLDHEYFQPGGDAGVQEAAFPYSLRLLLSFRHFQVRGWFGQAPWFAPFYRAEHASGALQVTAEILRAFARDVRARGKAPLVVIFPHGRDLLYFAAAATWSFQPLLDMLAADDVPLLNAGPALLARVAGGQARPGTLAAAFTGGDSGGHPNVDGYDVLAHVVHDELLARGLVPAK